MQVRTAIVQLNARDNPIVVVADIDLKQIEQVRAQVPSLAHRKPQVYRY